jgi:glutamyl-tRNA synthetase
MDHLIQLETKVKQAGDRVRELKVANADITEALAILTSAKAELATEATKLAESLDGQGKKEEAEKVRAFIAPPKKDNKKEKHVSDGEKQPPPATLKTDKKSDNKTKTDGDKKQQDSSTPAKRSQSNKDETPPTVITTSTQPTKQQQQPPQEPTKKQPTTTLLPPPPFLISTITARLCNDDIIKQFHNNNNTVEPDGNGTIGSETTLQVDPKRPPLRGDITISRFLARKHKKLYGFDEYEACEVDAWFDIINSWWTLSKPTSTSSLETHLTQLNSHLAMRTFMVGNSLSLADVATFAFLVFHNANTNTTQQHILRFITMCEAIPALQQVHDTYKQQLAQQLAQQKKKSTPPLSTTNSNNTTTTTTRCPILEGDPDPSTVVTRFPPEPSGHLHIGHCKALFLNQYYAKEYKGVIGAGKLLLRFDDTNPATEKGEYETAILEDLASLEIIPDKISHTSDYFDKIQQHAFKLIEKGLAYVDYSSKEELSIQRGRDKGPRVASPCRNQTVERNKELWQLLLKGEDAEIVITKDKPAEKRGLTLRAKITLDDGTPGYEAGNGSLRDPVLFRVVKNPPHAKTGTKYKAYPTYDMACPIVDSLEGVTHVLRDSQYADRAAQYFWLQKNLDLPLCKIQNFSRVNFKRTLMSKRKLAALVDTHIATGWDDPRFPTVKGMLRRGLQVKELRDFMVGLGGSMKQCDMEWDKIWSDNMRIIDVDSWRFMAIGDTTKAAVKINNFNQHHKLTSATDGGDTLVAITIPLLPKDPSAGTKSVVVTPIMYVEKEDLKDLQIGQRFGLMRYRVCIVDGIEKDPVSGMVIGIDVHIDENDQSFTTAKPLLCWVSNSNVEARVITWEHDYLLKEELAEVIGEEDEGGEQQEDGGGATVTTATTTTTTTNVGDNAWIDKMINRHSIGSCILIANSTVRTLKKGQVIQFERRGFYRVDKPFGDPNKDGEGGGLMEFIKIPDGKKKGMSIEGVLVHR